MNFHSISQLPSLPCDLGGTFNPGFVFILTLTCPRVPSPSMPSPAHVVLGHSVATPTTTILACANTFSSLCNFAEQP